MLDPHAKELQKQVNNHLKAAQALFNNGDYSNARKMLESVTASTAQWDQSLARSRGPDGVWNQHDTEQTMQELGLAQTRKSVDELKKGLDNLIASGRKIREIFQGLYLK